MCVSRKLELREQPAVKHQYYHVERAHLNHEGKRPTSVFLSNAVLCPLTRGYTLRNGSLGSCVTLWASQSDSHTQMDMRSLGNTTTWVIIGSSTVMWHTTAQKSLWEDRQSADDDQNTRRRGSPPAEREMSRAQLTLMPCSNQQPCYLRQLCGKEKATGRLIRAVGWTQAVPSDTWDLCSLATAPLLFWGSVSLLVKAEKSFSIKKIKPSDICMPST